MINSKIISTGSYLPKKILTNFDLEKMVDTSDEWIVERTGIKQRHIIGDDELTSDMALKASEEAIKNSGLDKNDIDMIVMGTTTPDKTLPATATILQRKLGIGEKCSAFDIQAVCSGFVYALSIADKFIKTGTIKTALVVGADCVSRIVNWEDRTTCVLFGDGAGAVVLTAETDEKKGILSSVMHSNGEYEKFLNTTGGVATDQKAGFVTMAGREIYKLAVNKMCECIEESLEKAGLGVKDIDILVPHQANQRILSHVARKLKLPEENVISMIKDQANTSGGSIPLALDWAVKNNKIKKGDIVVIEALGGGLTWGSIVVRW